jgi:large subunit ribosomal protein L4
MKLNIKDINGKKIGDVSVNKEVFGIEPNLDVVRQAILSELNNMRQGTHSAKNRAMVSGGGKKPWKQKGRGVARAGTIRSPLWKGGGTVFGPEPHSYNHKLPKKISKLARKSVLSSKVSDGDLLVIDNFTLEDHKTSGFLSILKNLNLVDKKLTILIGDRGNSNLDLSVRNLRNVHLVSSKNASTYDLIDCEVLIIDQDSVNMLSESLKG